MKKSFSRFGSTKNAYRNEVNKLKRIIACALSLILMLTFISCKQEKEDFTKFSSYEVQRMDNSIFFRNDKVSASDLSGDFSGYLVKVKIFDEWALSPPVNSHHIADVLLVKAAIERIYYEGKNNDPNNEMVSGDEIWLSFDATIIENVFYCLPTETLLIPEEEYLIWLKPETIKRNASNVEENIYSKYNELYVFGHYINGVVPLSISYEEQKRISELNHFTYKDPYDPYSIIDVELHEWMMGQMNLNS